MIQIKNRYTDEVILEGEYETLVDLINANPGANLYSANLESANLESANLVRANLYSANLESANLESANLYSANLVRANLYSANLESANLESANLYSANLESANLESANLESANLYSANLYSAKCGDLFVQNIYSIGPIGSRKAYLTVWLFTDGSTQYRAGCFSGTEQEFIAAVQKQHGDSKHAADYMAAIQFVNVLKGVTP